MNQTVDAHISSDEGKATSESRPLVSIITPVYNSKKTLERTLQSVTGQTYKNIEYIVIDGGSTDGSVDIIRQYSTHIDTWVSEPDKGISDAFNKGIRKARGELIGIINADDWYEPDAIANVMASWGQGDVYYGKTEFWNDADSEGIWDSDHKLLEKEMTLNHSAVFVVKKIYLTHGGFDEKLKFAMDYDLLLRLMHASVNFVKIDRKLSNMSLAGVSDQGWLDAYKEVRNIKAKYLGPSVGNNLYFFRQVFRRIARDFLVRLGLSNMVAYYRQSYSVVKKRNS